MNQVASPCPQRKRPIIAAAAALFAITASPAHAAPSSPLTPELLLESSPSNAPLSQAARDAAGDFAVVYYDWDPASSGNFLQTFHSDGTPYSPRIKFAPGLTNTAVAMDKDGDLTVAWVQADADPSKLHLMAQRYALDGTAKGDPREVTKPFRISPVIPISQGQILLQLSHTPMNLGVAMDDDGDFVVKWNNSSAVYIGTSYGGTYGPAISGASTYFRVFKPDGSPRSPAVRVQGPSTPRLYSSSLAMDASGNIIIAWRHGIFGKLLPSILAKRFDVNGQPLGALITVKSSSYFIGTEPVYPTVAADATGNFAVAWNEAVNDQTGSIGIQRYSSSGEALGAPLAITAPPGLQQVSLSMDRAGHFAVQWVASEVTDTQHAKLFAQYYAADGSILAPIFQITTTDFSNVMPNQVLLDGDGGLLSIWNGITSPGSSALIYGRLFSGPN